MGYERIHKVEMGVISPTRLRMKLLGSHGGGGGAKDAAARKSPRASPTKLDGDDADHPRNSLLPQELDEEYPKDRSDSSRSRSDGSRGGAARGGGSDGGGHFEFCKEERAAAVSGPAFFRQVPSKWNDAEKWIAGRHVVHSNPIFAKKPSNAAAAAPHSPSSGGRVAPESAASRGGGGGASAASALTELSSKSSSPASVRGPPAAAGRPPHKKLRFSSAPPASAAAVSVSMRDVGTEMTPIASQEQSRSGTPAGAATPSLSPLCSVPSSPRVGGASAASLSSSSSSSASERELQLRTRREIAALGLQLGKMNIASWASKEESLLAASPEERSAAAVDAEIKRKEFEARAAAWEQSKKCKLASRYQRKEVKIQEWESCQKSKFEAKLRQAEAQAEQMKARAKQNLAKRLSVLSHKVEGKQARVESRRSRQAARLARQVERIRKTGREPCRFRRCCTWLFL